MVKTQVVNTSKLNYNADFVNLSALNYVHRHKTPAETFHITISTLRSVQISVLVPDRNAAQPIACTFQETSFTIRHHPLPPLHYSNCPVTLGLPPSHGLILKQLWRLASQRSRQPLPTLKATGFEILDLYTIYARKNPLILPIFPKAL